jgi:HD-GYP domain-containing protein (c-di-GMP phosphodiesterase class II)
LQAVCDLDADAVLGMMHLDTASRYTIMHPLYVAILSELIGRVKRLSIAERLPLVAAALTANVSIIELQEQLQKQEGPLTDDQKAEMRLHPVKAVDMLLAIGVQDESWIATVLHHHEKIDGSGYPGARRGDTIPLSVRILSLADTYSAMVTPRVYRTSILARDALRDIFLKRGGEMDAELAQLFIKVLGVFPPGTFVKLQNGEVGIVTRRGENSMKPMVHAVIGPRGAPLQASIKRDTANADYAITEMVVRDRACKLDVHRMWGY